MPDPAELTEDARKKLEEVGWERGELGGPMAPPPVEYPEYFPGFGKELEQLGVEVQRAQYQVAQAERALGEATRAWERRIGIKITPGLREVITGTAEAALEPLQQEFDLALQNMKAIRWRMEVMNTLPNYLSIPDYKVQKAEDILQYIPLDSMSAEDTAWLTATYDRLQYLSNVLPEGFDGDAIEAQARVLDEILTAPKLELRAVHNLTVEEIAKSFAFGVAELPQGMTEEDVRYILSSMDLMDEEMKSAKDWLADRAKDWALESDRLNLIRAGTVLAETPELTPLEFGKLLFTQPMMATVQALDKYFSILPRPAAAAAIIGVHKLFKTPEDVAAARLEENYNYYRSMGVSSWKAYAEAFNDWDAPWYLKLGTEVFFDPISYIGLGFATAIGYKLGSGLTKAGVRWAGTRIGPWVGAVENGYISGADAIFKAGVEGFLFPIRGAFWLTGAGYQIPRTFTMMARNFARDSYMKFSSMLQRTYPEVRNLKGLTAKDAIDSGVNAIDQAIARPMEGWDAAVRAGAPMLEFGYIDDIAARRMTREIIEEVAFDTPRLVRLNNEVLNMFSGQGERVTAGKILGDLGQEVTEDMVNKMAAKLVAFKEKITKAAKDALKGDTATDVLMGQFNRLEGIRYGNLNSPLTKHMQQAGRAASWHSRVADRILYSSQLVALERRLVMPIARWNLLFANFGPYNFLENMNRSFLGGAELMYPKAYSGVHETNRLFKGLANAPYELQMFERGEARLAQALVDPKTGRTAVFKGGKVPFITRGVTIPEKVPFLGGKPVGARINIAGRDHYLTSFQDGYDMWAHFNSLQVAYDYQVHYMKELAKIAPDDMGRLTGVLAKHKSKLDAIHAIHPKDARDIERVLMQDATIGPDAIRAHQKIDVLEFERRQISKELNRTMDKCTEVRSTTKKGIQDDVLDGSIFEDIDGKMAAFLEQERELSLYSLKNQMNVLTDEADAFLTNPPRNLDEFLGDMQNISAMVEGTGERIHDYRRLTELRKAKLLPADMDDFEVGSAKLLAEFMETSEEQLTRMMSRLVERAKEAPVDWSLAKIDTAITKAGISDTVKGMVDKLPVNMKFDVRNIGIRPYPGRVGAGRTVRAYHDVSGRGIYFTELDNITPDILYHEMSHSHIMNMLESGGSEAVQAAGTVSGYAKAANADLVLAISADDIVDIARTTSTLSYPRFRQVHESLADEFAAWIGSPARFRVLKPNVAKFFDETYPLRTFKMNEVQLARLTDLDNVSRLEMQNMLGTRNKVAEIEAIIPRTPKKARNDRFWNQQRAQKSTIWDEYDTNARRFKSLRLRASRNFLDSVDKPVYMPDYIPEVVTELTPNHLAYLYGTTGDDLYRGLTRVQHHATIRPKEDFILHTREQAEAYAMKLGKSAADIGFTDDAIGEVYDQLWHNLGIEPSILTPDSPTVMQLEEIRQEVTRLYGAMKVPEADIVRYRQYINSVADDIEKLPIYREAAGTPEWWTTKESAMVRTREQHALSYPTYDDANIIDESMRAIFPFWNYECTLPSTKALTKTGWKCYTELKIGEDILTVNPATLVSEWQPIQRIVEYNHDGDLMVIPAKGKDIKFTPDHRWLVINEHNSTPKFKRGAELTDTYDMIPRAIPYQFPAESIIGSRLAAILGWIVADGYLNSPKTQRPYFIVYQSRYGYISEIEASTGTKAKPRSKKNDPDNMVIRVSANDTAEILKVYLGKPTLPELVSQLSEEAAEAMWRAMLLGEGSFGEAYNGLAVATWHQQPGPVSEAFQMLSILLGKAITVSDNAGLDRVYFINNRKQYQSKQCRRMRTEHYAGKVWCPVTSNGTWFANFNGCILPTGNCFRWRWIPRTAMRTPGSMTTVAKYVENTDQGYLPVPQTDLQMNMLRGSVWMGGLRSFYLRDFPEYYDVFPGMEFIDYIGRAGFFPGIHVMLPIVAFGAAVGKPEVGQLAPAWVRTGLSGLRTLSPEHIGAVLEHIYPDRFRDYMVMLTLGEEGYDADAIWRKKQTGEKLTPEEEELWLKAANRVDGVKGILMQQTGLFRIRPQEFTEIRSEMRLAIEEATGVPVRVQEQIDKQYPVTGKRFSDYYHLDVYQQKLLYEWETYRRWQGVTTPLYPSSWQLLDVKIRDYYQEVEKVYEEVRTVGTFEDGELVRPSMVEINRQWVEGEIGPDQWKALRSDIQGGLADAVRILGESPAYKDVPKTFEERCTMLEERNIPTPTQTPDQELLYYYYELRPEYKWNWESQRMERDFDTYYAYIDVLLESLDAPHRERLLQRIQADWTPLEKLYWQVSRDFMRPYRNLRDIVLREYDPEQIQQIRRFEVASAAEREQLQEIIGPDGLKLISGYQKRLREARQRLRLLDPNTDAWLNFFGVTTALLSTESEQLYEELRKKHLTKEMIK